MELDHSDHVSDTAGINSLAFLISLCSINSEERTLAFTLWLAQLAA